MLRLNDIVFGPIRSRRLGTSLGVNVTPTGGKLCNFDCIYCECGWNAETRTTAGMPGADEVAKALSQKLKSLCDSDVAVDSITFSGSGEPTLNPEFPQIVDVVLSLRDSYAPRAVVSVLSNATTLLRPEIRQALRKVDSPILKLDAPTDELMRSIDRPCGSTCVADVVKGMKLMDGEFVMQTMFLRGASPDFTQDPASLALWMDIVRQVRPRLVMAYTIDRPTPMTGLGKVSAALMRSLLQPLVDEGFKVQING